MSEFALQRIVVVDDGLDFLEYTRIVLHAAGYQVDTATSAAEGLALIRSFHPDLVIIDVMMSYSVQEGINLVCQITRDPVMGGYSVVCGHLDCPYA